MWSCPPHQPVLAGPSNGTTQATFPFPRVESPPRSGLLTTSPVADRRRSLVRRRVELRISSRPLRIPSGYGQISV